MSNYQLKQVYKVKKFTLEVHPYVAPPDNRFEDGVAIQYGADFKVSFNRGGAQQNKVGLIQLIFPRTKIFQNTKLAAWNVDKRAADMASRITMGRCLYGADGVKIGKHSKKYEGLPMRYLSPGGCWLIDTPREFNAKISHGFFSGITNTKFANYVVEMSSKNGIIFDPGMVWGYSVVQNGADPAKFDLTVLPPRESLLKSTNEHLNVIAFFLNSNIGIIKGYIS